MKTFGDATITQADDVDTLQFDWGRIKMLSDHRSTGAERSSFGLVSLQPGEGHERHNHPDSNEIIFVLSGEGTQMLNDEDPVEIGAGDCIYIPEGVYHATQNTGWEPLRLIIAYTPPGPGEVFRGMEECTVLPADEQ
jgi:oxalate decarboxylase/phosphoglucose isomerase-like protein (cupin superfamily)